MKPDPEPCGTSKRFIDQKSLRSARVVMKTTEGAAASKTAIVASSSGSRSAAGAASRGAPRASNSKMLRSRSRTAFLLVGSESTRFGRRGQKAWDDVVIV